MFTASFSTVTNIFQGGMSRSEDADYRVTQYGDYTLKSTYLPLTQKYLP